MELPFNKDNFLALQAAKTTVDNRLTETLANLDTANTALEAKDLELKTSKEDHAQALADAVVEAQDKFVTQTETRVKEAFAQEAATSDTIVAMINAESDEKSSEILLASEKSEALLQIEGNADVDMWAGIVTKKGK